MNIDNENEAENEKSHRYNINRPWPRHRHKFTKYKMCSSMMMVICIKQVKLSNTEAELKKKRCLKKKRVSPRAFNCQKFSDPRVHL